MLMSELKAAAERLALRDRIGHDRPSDLVQGTLAVAVRRYAAGPDPGRSEGDLKAWLRRIMVNVQRRGWRGRRPAAGLEGDRLASDTSTPCEKADRREQIEQMGRALAVTDEADRQLFRWLIEEKITYREMGERLGISKQAAGKRHAKALERLRIAFDRAGSDAAGHAPTGLEVPSEATVA